MSKTPQTQQRLAASRLRTARRLHHHATRQAQLEPTHENLTRAFALGAALKLIERLAAGHQDDDGPSPRAASPSDDIARAVARAVAHGGYRGLLELHHRYAADHHHDDSPPPTA